jgi:NadR type nicotinamide-nucleotide adenylyltransferase
VTVVVAPARIETIPLGLRVDWLREVHAGDPHVRIVGTYDDLPVDYADPDLWSAHCAIFRSAIGPDPVDAVFSSEAYGDELARRFGAVPVSVDPGRRGAPVSGTAVRADPAAHWHWLAPPVRAWFARRVVVLGAESTGTTTLARALARQFRLRGGVWATTTWVPEYGRELTAAKVGRLGSAATIADITWDRADFVHIAQSQNAAEDAAARAGSPLLVCDTDAFATAIWEERYLGSCSPAVRAAARRPDLYLLTADDDVPFVDDGLRDGEHLRAWMTARFRAELARSPVPWLELTGPYRRRLADAVAACDALLARGWSLAEPLRPRPGRATTG